MTFCLSNRLAYQVLFTLAVAIAVFCFVLEPESVTAQTEDRSSPAAAEQSTLFEPDPESSGDERTQVERWLGNFHPVSVHFPVALLAVAALAELLWILWSKPGFRFTSRFCLLLGTAGALLSATLGWFLAGYEWVDPQWELTTHRWLGTGTALFSPLVLALSEWSERRDTAWLRYLFRTTLFLGAVLVSVTGFFGGVLVYGWEHYQWPQPTEETSAAENGQSAAAVVEMNDAFRFDPESVTITAGETVTVEVGRQEIDLGGLANMNTPSPPIRSGPSMQTTSACQRAPRRLTPAEWRPAKRTRARSTYQVRTATSVCRTSGRAWWARSKSGRSDSSGHRSQV